MRQACNSLIWSQNINTLFLVSRAFQIWLVYISGKSLTAFKFFNVICRPFFLKMLFGKWKLIAKVIPFILLSNHMSKFRNVTSILFLQINIEQTKWAYFGISTYECFVLFFFIFIWTNLLTQPLKKSDIVFSKDLERWRRNNYK